MCGFFRSAVVARSLALALALSALAGSQLPRCFNQMASAPTACPMHSGSAISSASAPGLGPRSGSVQVQNPGCHRGAGNTECVGGSACQALSVASLPDTSATLMLNGQVESDHTNLIAAAPSHLTSPPSPPPQA